MTTQEKIAAMKERAEQKLAASRERLRTMTPDELRARDERRRNLQAKFHSSMVRLDDHR